MSERCAARVWISWDGWRGAPFTYRRCTRKPWKDGYCKQHHPETVKARDEAWRAKWAAESRTLHLQDAVRHAERDVIVKARVWADCQAADGNIGAADLLTAIAQLQKAEAALLANGGRE